MTEGDLTDVSETSSVFDIIWNFWVRTQIVQKTEHEHEQMVFYWFMINNFTIMEVH